MSEPLSESTEVQALLDRLRAGDRSALDLLLTRHRAYLLGVVSCRIDPRLRPRVDPSDVVQEAQVEAVRRIHEFLGDPAVPFRLWLRQLTCDRLVMLRRRHVGAARRSVQREQTLPDDPLAADFTRLASTSTPSQHLQGEELARRVRSAIGRLADADREILLLRSLEGLSFAEAAQLLGIDSAAARKRHARALLRLHAVLSEDGVSPSEL